MSEIESRGERLRVRLYVLAVLVLWVAFAFFVVQKLNGPILGYTDESIHAYQGYYVQKYLHFAPWPKLDLDNDALFYPYGNDQVFQSWVFERDLFSALCIRVFGLGPWVQIHYLFSVLVTALGVFFLLRKEHSYLRAAFAGLAVTFCNYYTINKFPGHANLTVLHWSLLGVVTDYVITRRIWRGEMPSARFLLWRVTLVFLALGQEMGYVAGLSLSSFVLTALWCPFLLWRQRTRPWREVASNWRAVPAAAIQDLRSRPAQTGLLIFGLAWGAFLYFPLVLEVFLHAKRYPVNDILVGTWWQWANPLRLFIPIVPGLEPVSSPGNFDRLINYFKDDPEAYFAMSPGLFFVLIGLLGVFLAARRKTLGALAPILVLWLLIVANHPGKFPTMHVFPWFSYVRTTAKLGNLNCLALVLLGIGGIPAGYFLGGRPESPTTTKPRQFLLLALALLFATETVTAYRLKLLRDRHFFTPDRDFYAMMETIRRSPGQGVFEWPFCVASGNGIGTYFFGWYFEKQSTLFCLQMLHDKKMVGGYYGRLFPQQIAPFFHAGWDEMFFPESRDLSNARRQSRDFKPPEWVFFEDFFRKNDFCGLLVSTDFLPDETVRQMHARFGNPVAVANGGSVGRLEFIARPPAWGRPANPQEGKSAMLMTPLTLPAMHIGFGKHGADDYLREGWSGEEADCRSTEQHAARMVFEEPPGVWPGPMTVDLFATTFEAQRFSLRFNGRLIKTWQSPGGEWRHFLAELPAEAWHPGGNDLTFDLPQAHRPPPPTTPGQEPDTRELGLRVESMDLKETAQP